MGSPAEVGAATESAGGFKIRVYDFAIMRDRVVPTISARVS
jgi:hypothetical protein